MNLDRVTEHPTALIGCLAWIPLSVWIIACVNWMIVGDIEALFGTVAIVVAVGLGYEAINPPVPELAPITVVAVLLTVIMFPFVRAAMNRRALRQVDVEALEKAYAALNGRPDNVVARLRIARVLFDLGVCGHAMRIVENQVPNMPQRFFAEDLRMLRRWHMMQLEAKYFAPINCSECGHSNQAGQIYCVSCGHPFLLDFARGKIVGSRLGKKLLAAWISMVMVLIGIPLATSLPPALSIFVIIVMMTFAIGMVVLAFRDTTGGVVK